MSLSKHIVAAVKSSGIITLERRSVKCVVPVLMCDSCLLNKKSTMQMVARCPLCVEENITILAAEVEYTNNGVDAACTDIDEMGELKAAPSVHKWGGGHASRKKEKRCMK